VNAPSSPSEKVPQESMRAGEGPARHHRPTIHLLRGPDGRVAQALITDAGPEHADIAAELKRLCQPSMTEGAVDVAVVSADIDVRVI
jgi:hypothetical protein